MNKNILENIIVGFTKSKERRVPCLVWYFTAEGVTTITVRPIITDFKVADYTMRAIDTIVVGKVLPVSMMGNTVKLINGEIQIA